ncbi:MAG: 3-phosphoshikimate 1-carboxyvinyltransferase, partial [Deltaproteobacteria bacterium HGW-Deltaproteobacteria-9]
LAEGNSFIRNALVAEDTLYLMGGLRALGVQIVAADGGFFVSGTAGNILNNSREIFLGNNGTALRILVALVTLGSGKYVLTGGERLCERPVGALVEALQSMNVDVSCRNNCPPVTVNAAGLDGGKITLKDIESSQYVSALLLCAPYAKKGVDLSLQGEIVSAPYIDLTISVMRDFGAQVSKTGQREYSVEAGKIYRGRDYFIEGDASSASYFFAAAAVLKKPVRVNGIGIGSKQGDMRLLPILEELGCKLNCTDTWIETACDNLRDGDFTFDLNDMPDMVPTLAVLAAFRKGKTAITNVAHLRVKESNRLEALVTQLKRIGIDAAETADGIIISGGSPGPANIETYNDHRIAMSFAVASLAVPGIEIYDKKCVDKSFPGFWEEIKKI